MRYTDDIDLFLLDKYDPDLYDDRLISEHT